MRFRGGLWAFLVNVALVAALGSSRAAPVLSRGPRAASSADLGEADRLARGGKLSEAAALYRIVAEYGGSPDLRSTAWLKAGRLSRDGTTAEEYLRRAVAVDMSSDVACAALVELAGLQYAKGNYADASRLLDLALPRLGHSALAAPAMVLRGRTTMALKQYDAAGKAFEDVSRARSSAQRGLYGWAQAAQAAGRQPQALALFDRYIAMYPGGDYLAGALGGAARAAEAGPEFSRGSGYRARLQLVAAKSFEFADLGTLPARSRGESPPTPAQSPLAVRGGTNSVPAPSTSRSVARPGATERPGPEIALRPQEASVAPGSEGHGSRTAQTPGSREALSVEEIRARIQKTKERQHQLEQELHGSAPAPDPRSPAEPEPAPKLRHPEPEEGAPGEESYLQFGVFSSEANAAALVRRLRSAGFRANLETLHQPTGIAYQVRGGDYPSRDQARAAAVRFREAGFPTQLKSGGH